MITKNIKFKNFEIKTNNTKIKKNLKEIFKKKDTLISSLSLSYKYSYSKKKFQSLKNT